MKNNRLGWWMEEEFISRIQEEVDIEVTGLAGLRPPVLYYSTT